jgi:hypothetical protein
MRFKNSSNADYTYSAHQRVPSTIQGPPTELASTKVGHFHPGSGLLRRFVLSLVRLGEFTFACVDWEQLVNV